MAKPSASLRDTSLFLQLQRRAGHDPAITQSWWEGTAALRNLKLLVGIGCLVFQKGIAGMDSLKKHVANLFSAVRHILRGQLKGWQPHFQPTVAKSSIATSVHWFAAVS